VSGYDPNEGKRRRNGGKRDKGEGREERGGRRGQPTSFPGQVYVALSRVKTLSGLQLLSPLPPSKITAHPEALKFYRLLCARQKKEEFCKKIEQKR
jgi:hypothetical protein